MTDVLRLHDDPVLVFKEHQILKNKKTCKHNCHCTGIFKNT